MWISYYFMLFCIYSWMGWIFETIYCTIKTAKWANRGFLFGPVCPIYGSAAVAVTALFQFLQQNASVGLTWWQIYIISVLGSAVLEFGTSLVLEKLFHASWWDYSYMRFNIQGRICLRNSLLFGVAGLVIVYLLQPALYSVLLPLPAIGIEAIALLMMAVISGDCMLTVCALTDLEIVAQQSEEKLNQHMEQFVNSLEEKRTDVSIHIAEEKKRFTQQHAEHLASEISFKNRSALRRIVKIRGNTQEKYHAQREMLFEALKRHKHS